MYKLSKVLTLKVIIILIHILFCKVNDYNLKTSTKWYLIKVMLRIIEKLSTLRVTIMHNSHMDYLF